MLMVIYTNDVNRSEKFQQAEFKILGFVNEKACNDILRDQIEVIDPGMVVISEECGDWEQKSSPD